MSLPDGLQAASYRGASFLVSRAPTTGGRKDVLKGFVSSDRQSVEDLGLLPRTFTLNGWVAPKKIALGIEIVSYSDSRDALLAALEKGGTGVLIHPFFGKLEDIVCRSWTLEESMNSVGLSAISITFAISDTDGVPVSEETVIQAVNAGVLATAAAVGANISSGFSVTASLAGNFGDAVDKVQGTADSINSATSFATVIAEEIDAFSKELTDLTAAATSLVANPSALSDSMTGVFETMKGLYVTPEVTFDAFGRLFDFGDSDTSFPVDTVGRIERQKNRDIMNNAMQIQALAYAYFSASQFTFENVDQIDDVSEVVEDQYQKILAAMTLNSSVSEELTKLRIAVTSFFDAQRVTRPQIISVRTTLTTGRLLAYQYYGDSALGNSISLLNGSEDATLEGQVRILTS